MMRRIRGPSLWGPPTWARLHGIAIDYPVHPSNDCRLRTLLQVLGILHELPCRICRDHAMDYIHGHPLDLRSSWTLQEWFRAFHNSVNQRTGKPTMSLEEYQRVYAEHLRAASRRRCGEA